MDLSHNDPTLTDAIKNPGASGNENEAREQHVADTRQQGAEDPTASRPGKGPRPLDHASTVGKSDAPKHPARASGSAPALPDPNDVGEAG